MRLFQEGVTKYGLPSRIRIDKGGENVDVAMYLLMHPLRGPGRSTVIVGRVCTIKGLNVCGEMCMKELSISTIVCFITWNLLVCLILAMNSTFSASTLFVFRVLTLT